MYQKLRRRIGGPILLLVTLITIGMWFYVGRPGCDTIASGRALSFLASLLQD
jgi:hypothetical protein